MPDRHPPATWRDKLILAVFFACYWTLVVAGGFAMRLIP
jgi:hypothetical protein